MGRAAAGAAAGGRRQGLQTFISTVLRSVLAAFPHLMYTVPALQPLGCGAKLLRGNIGKGVPSFQAAA